MNIGDYVRTKNGYLWKPKTIDDETSHWVFDDYYWYKKEDVKSSPNIIDLIEVGDYVNGSKVLDIAQAPKKAIYTEQENRGALLPIVNNRIESILTKEQFESMEYKL